MSQISFFVETFILATSHVVSGLNIKDPHKYTSNPNFTGASVIYIW